MPNNKSQGVPPIKTAIPKPLLSEELQTSTYDQTESSIENDRFKADSLLAYIIIAVITILIIVALQRVLLVDFVAYTDATSFPSAGLFIIGSMTALILLAVGSYLGSIGSLQKNWIFWLYLLALVLFTFWTFNLQLRAERFSRGLDETSAGDLYIISLIVVTCILFVLASYNCIVGGISVFLALGWFVYLLYNWWFDASNCDGQHVNRAY